ncbi:MAG TPA: GTPase, partial [Elainellaceae cyanobacterium]
ILTFMKQRSHVPMIIGLTHVDCQDAWEPENIGIALGYLNASKCPLMIRVNPTDASSVARTIIKLVEHST